MFKNCTAEELANMLEGMSRHSHNTGGLSMLDEATLAFGRKSPKIMEAQQIFSTARHLHHRSWSTERQNYSDKLWRDAMESARGLADLLRPLGDMRIARCERQADWGTCNLPLSDDGVCRSSLGHTDENR